MATNILSDLSTQLADAVETAASGLVTVKGRARQAASGVVYAPGLVLTANHVLERDEDLAVGDASGNALAAQLVGRDPATDLALLRVPELKAEVASPAGGTARVG